jgi:hypothetical protein
LRHRSKGQDAGDEPINSDHKLVVKLANLGDVVSLSPRTPRKSPGELQTPPPVGESQRRMIRKLKSGEYRLYSRKKNPKTGKRRNLGTFNSKRAAEAQERALQFFKRH